MLLAMQFGNVDDSHSPLMYRPFVGHERSLVVETNIELSLMLVV